METVYDTVVGEGRRVDKCGRVVSIEAGYAAYIVDCFRVKDDLAEALRVSNLCQG